MQKKMSKTLFDELWDIIENENKIKLLLGVGYYYFQYSESLKDQIAVNAVIMNFQGYRVGVLNFLSPELTKPVSRQIITHFKNKGTPVDFAVCWGYEHNGNNYRIQLTDDHKQRLINMAEIAQKLGKIGGNPKGGGGHPHVGNFYWPRNEKYDIWDLFTKQFL
jgi:hydroxymethylpyrimidine pyrophosphatase-like HAD family hydrolase